MQFLVAANNQLFLDGLCHIIISMYPDVKISATTRASEVIDNLATTNKFDLILLELNMPGIHVMSVLHQMRDHKTWLPLVVISSKDDPHMAKSVVDAGAFGFIPKSHNSHQMNTALRIILNGNIYIPENTQKQIHKLRTTRPPIEADINKALKNSGITKRQYDVLQLLAKGYTNKQIATCLFLTEHTIKVHVSALFTNLNAKNRTECVQRAERNGIL